MLWSNVEAYASDTTAVAYQNSLPAVMLGLIASTTDLATLYAVLGSGSVFSAEWIPTSKKPVGRMYSHSTGLCWQATYSAVTGYGSGATNGWTQTTTGPLGVSCSAVTSASWYTSAQGLSSGGTSVSAGTISSGYIGITYMMHESTNNAVFGGEMDGRTLSNQLNKGKPIEGEMYIVSAGAAETLVATTETSVQPQLQRTSSLDPTSVGGLTGSSSATLQSSRDSFTNLWSGSATVAEADTAGYVATRCPSETTNAYVSIQNTAGVFESNPSVSVKHFTSTSGLQLLLVSAIEEDTYNSFVLPCTISTIVIALGLSYASVQMFTPHQSGSRPWLRTLLCLVTTALLIATMCTWTIEVRTRHRSAVDDLFGQVLNSTDTLLATSLNEATKMVKQAHHIWRFTGAPTTASDLVGVTTWSTSLMTDYYSKAKLTSLRFATTGGLERSVNGTAVGTRILIREFYNGGSSCVRTYKVDGITEDAAAFPDNCHYGICVFFLAFLLSVRLNRSSLHHMVCSSANQL